MRNQRWIALAFVLALTLAAHAQDNLTVNIPFDFTAGAKSLPAGEYTVQRVGAGPETVVVRSATSEEGFLLASSNFDFNLTGTKLVFHRYGSTYFLSSIVTPAGAHIFHASKQEQHLARSMPVETVESVGTN